MKGAVCTDSTVIQDNHIERCALFNVHIVILALSNNNIGADRQIA